MKYLKKILILLGSILIHTSLLTCQSMEKKYRYDLSAFTPYDYNVEFYLGYMSSRNHKSIPLFQLIAFGSWGIKGGGNAIGSGLNYAPDSLHIGYYTDVEDKFYEGHFALPYDKIVQLLEEDSDDPDEKGRFFSDTQSGKNLPYRKYDALSLSIAPGGDIYLWATGLMHQTFIAKFKAGKSKWGWEVWLDERMTREEDRAYFLENLSSKKIKKELETNTLPYGLWDNYFTKFNWKYTITHTLGAEPVSYLQMKTINAEEETYYPPYMNTDTYKERAVPYWVKFNLVTEKGWQEVRVFFGKGMDYYRRAFLDAPTIGDYYPDDLREEEVYKVFHNIGQKEPIEIEYKVDLENEKVQVLVKTKNRTVELKDIITVVFPPNRTIMDRVNKRKSNQK